MSGARGVEMVHAVDVDPVMILVEVIANHLSHDGYRRDGSRSQVLQPTRSGSYADTLAPPWCLTCGFVVTTVSVCEPQAMIRVGL
jgi:hypothetical protein